MTNSKKFYSSDTAKKEFLKIFKELCYCRQPWEVWSDVITVMACSIVNAVDREPKRYESREKEYAACIKRLKGVEKPAQLFAIVVNALESNPDQDFLGSLYMQLELGNHWKAQYFTPYEISRMMAEITIGNCQEQIEKQGWLSIGDMCIGGGAMMIAAANNMRRQKILYHNHVLFVGQDIDRIASMMAYIQLSLLGCPGYIVVANTLTNPLIGNPLIPAEQEGQEFWYTPLFFSDVWHWRRVFDFLNCKSHNETKANEKEVKKENFFIFFDFEEKEEQHGRKQELKA